MLSEQTDDTGSNWYENDLQLAAELGKALLERNIDLENQLHSLQLTFNEQTAEQSLLRRQLEALRALDESRARACEDIDRTAQELEKTNLRLKQERRNDALTINTLTETVSKLEQRIDELELSLSKEKAHNAEQERGRRRESRRARSVPGRDPTIVSREFRGLPASVSERDAIAASFRIRLEVARARCCQAEKELASVLLENHDLNSRIHDLESAVVAERSKPTLPSEERAKSPVNTNALCSECKKRITAPPPFDEPFEHDLEELPRGTGRLVRLKNGGSAFGSRDSLYRIGLEPDDATPGREVCSAILAAGFQQVQSPNVEVSSTTDGGGSLLAELEEQYRKLVVRYEALIDAKSANAVQVDSAKSSNLACSARPQDLPLESPDPTVGHFDNGPPEYKRLFREIFETLRRSADLPSSDGDK